jgi:tRNA nucleotidyltransferase/poly(A) polymerase
MLEQGFDRVGADFPVFLHPETKEEYALARTERKVAAGYHGFETDFDPSVTLADDLVRRDLTINAMALEEGTTTVIDLFGGQKDLEDGVLRHVSEAFAEDPVRVLRVARFRARYNFDVAPETMELMKKLVDDGELDTLVPERVWAEMEKALMEDHPSLFFKTLQECGALERVMPGLGWLSCTLPALDRCAGRLASLDQRVMALMSGTHDVQGKLKRLTVPVRTIVLAVKFQKLMDELRWDVDAARCINILKKLDAWRMPTDLETLVLPYHEFDTVERRLGRLLLAHSVAKEVSFASLTDEQRTTLKGPEVGKAIDDLRRSKLEDFFLQLS